MSEERYTDVLLEQAKRDLAPETFAEFEFYMRVYQSLTGDRKKEVLTRMTVYAWTKTMDFLEERMHELVPSLKVIDRHSTPELPGEVASVN